MCDFDVGLRDCETRDLSRVPKSRVSRQRVLLFVLNVFFKMKQINLPCEAEVGLVLADAVHAGVRSTEVEADAAVA